MSLGRGTTDTIVCEVSNCRQRFHAGSVNWALTSHDAREVAARSGWTRGDDGRDLCPTHSYLAARSSSGSESGSKP